MVRQMRTPTPSICFCPCSVCTPRSKDAGQRSEVTNASHMTSDGQRLTLTDRRRLHRRNMHLPDRIDKSGNPVARPHATAGGGGALPCKRAAHSWHGAPPGRGDVLLLQ